jgi:hypothetical protein
MTPNVVQVYYSNCLNLAKTLCIKSEDSANALNNYLINLYGTNAVDLTNPASWKYYLNISGQYHPTDTMMQVTSLDNLQTIDFTTENLALNPATAQGYAYGSRYYYSLINQYPSQEQLILGILYPANIQTAISATDGTILAWPSEYIESQEIKLIPDLQEWIYNYFTRWNVKAFINSDDLYQISFLSIFYLNLYIKIINLRLHYCKTPFAHTFHITQFLASHHGLDQYMPYMTQEQILYLYRNILYIERHPGWTQTFQTLINELLTIRNIPIAEYYVRLQSVFTNYRATLSFDRQAINPIIDSGNKNQFTYEEFLQKTTPLAPGNSLIFNSNQDSIQTFLQNSSSDSLLTKDLESAMYDYTDSAPHTLTQIFLNEWLYLSANGYYDAVVNFTDPTTLIQYTLSSLDAFIYMSYLYIKSCGITVVTIPNFYATKVLKTQAPSISSMTALCDNSYTDAQALATYLINSRPSNFVCESVLSFYNLCTSIFNLGLNEWYQISGNGEVYHRGELWNMADYQYIDTPVSTSYTGSNMAEWITSRGLADPDANTTQITDLIQVIYQAGTGLVNVQQVSFQQIQQAMISILSLLSSYSVQIMSSINKNPIILLNWAAIRAGQLKTQVSDEFYVPEDIDIVDYKSSSLQTLNFVTQTPISNNSVEDVTVNVFQVYFKDDTGLNFLYNDRFTIITPNVIVTDSQLGIGDFSNYSSLSPTQASTLPDIYQNAVR